MNRIVAALAALALAPAALAQQAQQGQQGQDAPPAQEAQQASQGQEAGADAAALSGKIAALEEQVAEMKGNVDALRRLRFSGYVQARWAWNETAEPYYNTTPADAPAQNGFHLRRGRFKVAYDADWSQYVVQIDVIPAGVTIKEGYATIKLPKGFAIDAGLQLFPFGYEVYSRSSSDLDTLERAAVTRAFLGGEYDLGVALRGKLGLVDFKVGLFNGNGFESGQRGSDNDQLKDVIGRATVDLGMITAGVSGWYGKTINYARDDDKDYPRLRYGADLQLFLDLLPIGGTALKGEYIWGQTTIGTSGLTSTPPAPNGGAGGNLPGLTSDAPVPTGAGWYAMLTQNVLDHWQLAGRYESYVPDRTPDLSATSRAIEELREIQIALHTFIGGNMKVTAAWFHPTAAGDKGGAAPPVQADRYIVQAQAKF